MPPMRSIRAVGVDEAYRAAGNMFYTVESHITHHAEVRASEPMYVTTQVWQSTTNACICSTSCYRRRDDALIASGEQLYLHVEHPGGKAAPMMRRAAQLEAIGRTCRRCRAPAEAGVTSAKPVGGQPTCPRS